MSSKMNRRAFVKQSVLSSAAAAAAMQTSVSKTYSQEIVGDSAPDGPTEENALPKGRIRDLQVSRLWLGGNLLTHYTHSRDLKYVYNLTQHYNTEEKILETLQIAEEHGINTVSMHTVPRAMRLLMEHRRRGGKMKWIICPTAKVKDDMAEYGRQVEQLVNDGVDAIYLWGVHADKLSAQGRVDLMAEAVAVAKDHGVPSGVGGHDLGVIVQCEKNKIDADFYIKTLHHHEYPTAPKPDELKTPYSEIPGYWCKDPQAVINFMKTVEKPWVAFKVMAAGAIPPKSAFEYAFRNGADFLLAGMFDFEIYEDRNIAKEILARNLPRERPWRA